MDLRLSFYLYIILGLFVCTSISSFEGNLRLANKQDALLPQEQSSPSPTIPSLQSSFEALFACEDGMIGLGVDCSCGNNTSCLFASLRNFLPSKELINDYLKSAKQDMKFSKEFSKFLYRNAKFEKHRGFPLDLKCHVDPDPQKLCQSSFGKFLRYNSILEYARFNIKVFLKNETDSLYDIVYPEKFRWAENIPECDQGNSGWNCAFYDMSSPHEHSMNETTTESFQWDFLYKAMRLIEARTKRRNHIAQILIYGKLLSMLSRPNRHILEFMNKTIERTSINMSNAAKNIIQEDINKQENRVWRVSITNFTEASITNWQPNIYWLSCENSETVLLTISVRFHQKRIVYNSRVGGVWSANEGSIPFPSVSIDELKIEVVEKPNLGFKIFAFKEAATRAIFPFPRSIPKSKSCNLTVDESLGARPLHSILRVHEAPSAPIRSEKDIMQVWLDVDQNTNNSLSGSPPTVSMHVRHGDSCDSWIPRAVDNLRIHTDVSGPKGDWSRSCFELSVYIQKLQLLRELYGVRKVYLATDSPDMISLAKLHTEYEWVYLRINRHTFDHDRGWINEHLDNIANSKMIFYSAVTDIELLKEGDFFLGTFASHYSKLIYFNMVGEKMRLVPFISLDFPMSCDTIDLCGDEDVIPRNQSIEDIIYRTPNCQRQNNFNLIGWVTATQDPCGIY